MTNHIRIFKLQIDFMPRTLLLIRPATFGQTGNAGSGKSHFRPRIAAGLVIGRDHRIGNVVPHFDRGFHRATVQGAEQPVAHAGDSILHTRRRQRTLHYL